MALHLPNGATVHVASLLDAEKNVTVATNAAECELTVTAHGFANGDFVVLQSGWGELNERVFRISGVATDKFKLSGVNTTDTEKFPAGSGTGSVRKVKTWTQLTQIMDFSTQGGEQQYYSYGFLEDDFERQMPTTKSAMSINIGVGDDISLPGYQAAKAASDAGGQVPLQIRLKSGNVIVYNGYLSINETPTMTRNEGMKIQMSYAISGKVNRY